MSETSPPLAPIPENLRKLLLQYRARVWRMKVAESVLAGLLGLLFSFLLVFALDRVITTSPIARLVILLLGFSLAAVFAPWWIRKWIWGHKAENQLAKLIAKSHPNLGDRLLGIIELQGQNEAKETLSPELRAAAMQHIADEVEKRGLQTALPPSWLRKALLGCAAACAMIAAAFYFTPRAGKNALMRWALPLADTPRFTFTQLKDVPKELIVPHGESFTFSLLLDEKSEWKPEHAELQIANTNPNVVSLSDKSYSFTLPPMQSATETKLVVGDAAYEILIKPTLRPTIESAQATLKYPSYLSRSDSLIDLKTGVAQAVEGAALQISLQASRELSEASYQTTYLNEEGNADVTLPSSVSKMKITKANVESATVTVSNKSSDLLFSWEDEFGLKNDAARYSIRIEAIKDRAPSTFIQGIEKQKVILPEETIEFEAVAEDDFGLKELSLTWEGENTPTSSHVGALAKGEMLLLKGGSTATTLQKAHAFSPATLKIGPQKLILRTRTVDAFPGRDSVFSEPIIVYILTRDEHAQMLKNQFDRVIGELEDATRREQNSNEELQRLDRLKPDELQKSENQQRLEAQQKAEQENTQKLSELKKRMEDMLKNAARNGEIPKETMKKMAESMKSLEELSEQDMPQVEQKLSESQQQNNTPEQSKKDLAQAEQDQEKVLEKMKQTLEKARDANKDMEAGTFVNRLKKAASNQDGIAASLIDSFSKSLGRTKDTVDPSVLSNNRELDIRQENNSADIRWIQEDLGNYFTRTNKQVFQDVQKGMNESSIVEKLENIRERLAENQGFRAATASKHWSGKLSDWAKMLEDAVKKNSNGGGGGGGASPEDEDFEFMLRVMKMIQKEQDLRARTRALEDLKRSLTPMTP